MGKINGHEDEVARVVETITAHKPLINGRKKL